MPRDLKSVSLINDNYYYYMLIILVNDGFHGPSTAGVAPDVIALLGVSLIICFIIILLIIKIFVCAYFRQSARGQSNSASVITEIRTPIGHSTTSLEPIRTSSPQPSTSRATANDSVQNSSSFSPSSTGANNTHDLDTITTHGATDDNTASTTQRPQNSAKRKSSEKQKSKAKHKCDKIEDTKETNTNVEDNRTCEYKDEGLYKHYIQIYTQSGHSNKAYISDDSIV